MINDLLRVRDELSEVGEALNYLAVNNENQGFAVIANMIKEKIEEQEKAIGSAVQKAANTTARKEIALT